MTEITLIDNLQQLMRIHGNISVSELARLTEIPQPTIHHILTGSTKNPRKKALEELSRFFSISIEQLTGQEPLPAIIPEGVKKDLQISSIPIVEWDSLKSWPFSKVDIKENQEVLLNKKVASDSFALIIPNESMLPRFQQNTLLIFDSGKTPKDRDYVIVHLSKDNIIEFNRLFYESNAFYIRHDLGDGNLQLTKLDPSHDRILGILIEERIQH
jgi:transcriptional regulator with XRE-family HTH domain